MADIGSAACDDASIFNDYTKVLADPDIAGKGVIIAFVVTAGLALVTSYMYVIIEDLPDRNPWFDKHRWCALLEVFILSLSDQHLLTGLAVLIAASGR